METGKLPDTPKEIIDNFLRELKAHQLELEGFLI